MRITRPADKSASCLLGADEKIRVLGFPRIVYSLYRKLKLMPLFLYAHPLTSSFPWSALSRRRLWRTPWELLPRCISFVVSWVSLKSLKESSFTYRH